MNNKSGYTNIDNELLKGMFSSKFNGTQIKILVFIIRYTYGYNRTEYKFSAKFIADNINCTERAVRKEISNLLLMNVLKTAPSAHNNQCKIYSINPPEQWLGKDEYLLPEYGDPFGPFEEQPFSTPAEQSFSTPAEQSFSTPAEQSFSTPAEQSFSRPAEQPFRNEEQPFRNTEQSFTHINTNINKNINTKGVYIKNKYTPQLENILLKWIDYRNLNDESIITLADLTDRYRINYSDTEITDVIAECLSEGRNVIYWDRLERKRPASDFQLMTNNTTSEDLEYATFRLLSK